MGCSCKDKPTVVSSTGTNPTELYADLGDWVSVQSDQAGIVISGPAGSYTLNRVSPIPVSLVGVPFAVNVPGATSVVVYTARSPAALNPLVH